MQLEFNIFIVFIETNFMPMNTCIDLFVLEFQARKKSSGICGCN